MPSKYKALSSNPSTTKLKKSVRMFIKMARYQWLMPIILAPWKTELGRIGVCKELQWLTV
jgi:hypothetical protein